MWSFNEVNHKNNVVVYSKLFFDMSNKKW